MAECFRCGVSDSEEEVLEAIYKSGVVNICVKCYSKLRIPIIERKKVDWEEVDRRVSVRDRLKKASGSDSSPSVVKREKYGLRTDDVTLDDIVKKNLEKNKVSVDSVSDEVVDNFNWIIMRKRRILKMSQFELAESIFVPEVVVSALEKGTLPMDYKKLLKKIESVLSVSLFKGKQLEKRKADEVENSFSEDDLEVELPRKKSFSFNLFKKKEDKTEKEFKDEEIELDKMTLDTVNDLIGEPVEKDEKKRVKEVEKNQDDSDVTSNDIHKFAWGGK